MPISNEDLAQILFGGPAPQGEAGTGAPMQSSMQPTPSPDPILAEVGSMIAQPAGDFQPRTVEYSLDGTATPQATQLPPGGSFSAATGTKTSDSGFSTAKLNEIDKSHVGRSGTASKFDAAEAKVRARFAGDKTNFESAYKAAEAATAAVGSAESEKIMAEAGHMNTIAGIQRKHADALKALSIDGALAAQKAKDEYRARLISIPELNPHALWDEAGKEGQFAMGVAAFVHDFLGAKGIKTSAMDTINQAIKNKIDSQIYNINTKKQVAQGFKDLYDMTVADSASKMEVEAKLQGYYLKAVETGIKAQMGGIDSNVARAKSQLALTEVRKAQAQKQFEIDQHIEAGIKDAHQIIAQMRGQDMQASIAKADRESRERVALADRQAKTKEAKPKLYIFDGETGKGVLRIRDGVPDTIAAKAMESAQSFYSADKEMLKLRELERKLDPQFDGFVGTRLSDEDARIYHATTLRLAHAMVKAMNEKATDKDVDQYMKSLPMPTDFTRGGVSRVLADTHTKMHNELDGIMLQATEDVPENEQPQGPKNKLFGASSIDAEKGTKVAAGPSENEQTATRLRSPDSLSPMSEPKTGDEAGRYRNFTQPYWADYRAKGNRTKVDISRSATSDFAELGRLGDAAEGKVPPKAFDELRELAENAFHGDQEALAYLKEATTIRNTSEEEFQISEMASYFIDLVDKAKRNEVDSTGHQIHFGD